jgi:hypothetical protein
MEIQSREQLVLHRLTTFYSNEVHLARIRSILSGESKISLRLIDWLVTNYAKKFNISYVTKKDARYVIVYLTYKSHLKAYSKKMFDPFCRWTRVNFHGVSTTVGQLNFFAWAMEDDIIDYLFAHHDDIHADMETRMSAGEKKTEHTRKKRHELSHSATKSLKHHDVKITVSFK